LRITHATDRIDDDGEKWATVSTYRISSINSEFRQVTDFNGFK
jgi:hypothetical protein